MKEFIFYLGSFQFEIFSIPDLSIVYEHQGYTKNISLNCLTQINNDEIIYSDGLDLKIFNIKYFKLKITYKNSKDITSLTKLKDNTILICTSSGITRFETKHFEEICLIFIPHLDYDHLQQEALTL
jgi:plasmid replication initiation protein